MKAAPFNFQSVFKKIVIFLLLVTCHLSLLTAPAFAQTYNAPNTNSDVPNNLHNWTQNVMIEVMSAMSCQIAGVDPTSPNQACLGIDPKTKKIGFVKNGGGAIGLMGNMIAMTLTPPIHFGDYTTYLAQNFGLVKPAYAAVDTGTGFFGLSPLLGMWTTFRNIVYLIYIAAFAIVGFAIMLRIKIDPRTVMTISNQLPKIIISILLVTLSFAIAGALIDIMFIATYVTTNTLASTDPAFSKEIATTVNKNIYTPPVGFVNELQNKGLGGIVSLASYAGIEIQNIIGSLFQPTSIVEVLKQGQIKAQTCSWTDFGCWAVGAIGGTYGNIMSTIIGWLVSWIVGILAFLIIIVALLWALFRLWFMLISAYIFILLDVVFAPFWIVGGISPGTHVGFIAWLRDMFANLSVFPVTITMFLLARVFVDLFGNTPSSSGLFIPPLIGNPNATHTMGAILALGIILLTPQVAAMMRDLFKPPPFKYTAGVGQALGVGPGIASGAFNSVFSPYGSLTTMTRAGSFFGAIKRGEGLRGAFKAVQTPGGEAVHNPPPHQSK